MSTNTYEILDSYNSITKNKSRFTFFYLNARSICKKGKLDELRCILQTIPNTVHVILLTETWIRTELQAQRLQLPNYTHYYNYRTNSAGGGVSAYVHNNIKHSLSESKYIGGNNYLWVKLEKFALEVGVVYNPGHTDFNEFLKEYEYQLEQRRRAIVFGDFNVDLLSKEKKTKQYKQLLKESGHRIINKVSKKFCTREGQTRKSILDHISTNLKKDNFHMITIDSPFSDHKQIYLEIKKVKPPPKISTTYKAINYTKLQSTVERRRFQEVTDDYTTLERKIKHCIKDSEEIKTKILNRPQDDWINRNIISEINERNILWVELKKKPNNEILKTDFKKKSYEVTKLIQDTRDSYYYNKFTQNSKNPRKMWNLVNTLAVNKIQQNCAPPTLIFDSREIKDPYKICDTFNEYFSSIGQHLASLIPKNFHDQRKEALPLPNVSQRLQMASLKPCSEQEILNIISHLDSNCSVGLDGINTKTIKCLKYVISNKLADCFNRLFDDGNFPDTLKVAKVTPVYKSGSKTDPGNYRPISVLPVLSKILEKLLHTRLQNYLDSINYISKQQYGFRPKSNTLTATIDLVTKIKQNIDKKNIVLGIFVDLKKAFDTVSHELLLQKLEFLGITGKALQMFKSYLTQRSQIVKINSFQSKSLPITCGIPQGSILGPLLFLIYINNIQELGLNGHITLYADDTCLFYFGSSIHNLILKAQEDLNILQNWFQNNLLTINISKTCYTIFKAKNKQIPSYTPLTIDNTPLQEKNKEKYLGLHMDTYLSWKEHINHVKTKLITLSGSLRNIVRCIPRNFRYNIYNALVKPHLTYLIEVWGCAVKTRIRELQIIQNKIIKLIFSYKYLTPTKKIYEETKLMTIKKLYFYSICIFIRKTLNRNIHTSIAFQKQKHVTIRSTRRASFLVLPKPRTTYGKTMITYEGAQFYNRLPLCIKNAESLNVFKKELSKYILDNQFC